MSKPGPFDDAINILRGNGTPWAWRAIRVLQAAGVATIGPEVISLAGGNYYPETGGDLLLDRKSNGRLAHAIDAARKAATPKLEGAKREGGKK